MAFYSEQGTPFAQAVGLVDSTSRKFGSLTAYRDGSLGDDCPPCRCDSGDGSDGSGQREADDRFAMDTPKAWHDGIFRAHEAPPGTLRAFSSGTVGMPSEVIGLGLPLYINGREVKTPITLYHGASGLGALPEPDPTSYNLNMTAIPGGLGDAKLLLVAYVASKAGEAVRNALPSNYYGEGNLVTPWGVNDASAVREILNTIPAPGQLTLTTANTIVAQQLATGNLLYPTPQLLLYLAWALKSSDPAAWDAVRKKFTSPFFTQLIPFWLENFEVLGAAISELNKNPNDAAKAKFVSDLTTKLRPYPESVYMTWADGTITRGSGLINAGAATKDLKPIDPSALVVPDKDKEKPQTNYLLWGGVVAGVAALFYLTTRKPGR